MVRNIFIKKELILFFIGLIYAIYWQTITPIQYTGDSESYNNLAHMLLGHPSYGIPLIFRPPGYPIFLAITGVPLGTFKIILVVQALFAAFIPCFIYRIIAAYNVKTAMVTAIFAIASGIPVIHCSHIMTEQLFMFLLFLGLTFAVKAVKNPKLHANKVYWFAVILAALNTVRPIAGPMFWVMWLLICCHWWYTGLVSKLIKKILGSAIIFIGLMAIWIVGDDIFFSEGARYSPSNLQQISNDSKLDTYLYDLPFNEAYYNMWSRKIDKLQSNPTADNSLTISPAMTKVSEIVKAYLLTQIEPIKIDQSKYEIYSKYANNIDEFIYKIFPNYKYANYLQSYLRYLENDFLAKKKSIIIDQKTYPYELFGKYINNPDELIYKMFTEPNYRYANFIRTAVEVSLSAKERKKLFYLAAKEAGTNWPMRWLSYSPIQLFLGPAHGGGAMKFALAYGPLRIPGGGFNSPSIVQPENGPASRLLFSTIADILRNNPEFWQGYTDKEFQPFFNNPNALIQEILAKPTYNYTWFITIMLWQTMGYENAAKLMGKAAHEAFAIDLERTYLHIWNTLLMVAAGPALVQFDSLSPSFARIDIYAYMTSGLFTKNHIKELDSTRNRYNDDYLRWQNPTRVMFHRFYLTKPLFMVTSILGIAILWARREKIIIPLLVMVPHCISILIYGTLFTALPRYTDPTILIPMLVTFLAIPTVIQICKERMQQLYIINNFHGNLDQSNIAPPT